MNPLAWLLLADTLTTALAVVLALLAWRMVGGYVRHARNVVQAREPRVDEYLTHVESYVLSGRTTWGDIAQLLAEEYPPEPGGLVEDTLPHRVTFADPDPVVTAELLRHVDPHPSGRHARVDISEPVVATAAIWPADDTDAGPVPSYAFAHMKGETA